MQCNKINLTNSRYICDIYYHWLIDFVILLATVSTRWTSAWNQRTGGTRRKILLFGASFVLHCLGGPSIHHHHHVLVVMVMMIMNRAPQCIIINFVLVVMVTMFMIIRSFLFVNNSGLEDAGMYKCRVRLVLLFQALAISIKKSFLIKSIQTQGQSLSSVYCPFSPPS